MVVLNTGLCHLLEPVVALAALVAGKLLLVEGDVGLHEGIVDILLTVCTGIVIHISVGISLSTHIEELLGIHCFGTMTDSRETYPTIVRELSFALLTLLGGDNDYTVGSTRTVECGCRCVFEHLYRLNVVHVD